MSTKPTGSHQLPSTSTPLSSPQWPRLYGIGSAASCPAVEDGATATPKNSPGDVAIVPSSAAALRLIRTGSPFDRSKTTCPAGRNASVLGQPASFGQPNGPTSAEMTSSSGASRACGGIEGARAIGLLEAEARDRDRRTLPRGGSRRPAGRGGACRGEEGEQRDQPNEDACHARRTRVRPGKFRQAAGDPLACGARDGGWRPDSAACLCMGMHERGPRSADSVVVSCAWCMSRRLASEFAGRHVHGMQCATTKLSRDRRYRPAGRPGPPRRGSPGGGAGRGAPRPVPGRARGSSSAPAGPTRRA